RRGEYPARPVAMARLGGRPEGHLRPGSALAGGRAAGPAPGGRRVQPGVHGAGGRRLHAEGPDVPDLPGRRRVPRPRPRAPGGPALGRVAWQPPEALPRSPFGAASRRLAAWVAARGLDAPGGGAPAPAPPPAPPPARADG